MMKHKLTLYLVFATLLFSSCGSYSKVVMSSDYDARYEVAKQAYTEGNYSRCANLLTDMIVPLKGTDKAEESLYMMAMAEYGMGDYETANVYFKQFYTTYPKGEFTELARYNSGKALYNGVPDPRLDQTNTSIAIQELQTFLDYYPSSEYSDKAQNMIFELQDKLVQKEYLNAKLYYDLGSYFGNCTEGGSNYEACVVTCENTLKDYPYTKLREELYYLSFKAKYELAQQSVDEKKEERYRNAIDDYFGFKNEFPESKHMKELDGLYTKASKHVNTNEVEEE